MGPQATTAACVIVAGLVLALGGRGAEAFCGLRAGDGDGGGGSGGGGGGDFVACLKSKAIVILDRASRADVVPLVGSVSLVQDEAHARRQRSDDAAPPVVEQELRSKPDDALDRMLYDRVVRFFSGRVVRIGLPDVTPEQLRQTLDEGRGKMKKTMGMMMTAAAMKAMMVIPLALGVLFLMAGKAMIISKIALVLSLIITLKKLISKSGEHVIHETHSSSAAWPSGGSSIGYGGGGGGGGASGGWDKRSSAIAGQTLAYNSYKP